MITEMSVALRYESVIVSADRRLLQLMAFKKVVQFLFCTLQRKKSKEIQQLTKGLTINEVTNERSMTDGHACLRSLLLGILLLQSCSFDYLIEPILSGTLQAIFVSSTLSTRLPRHIFFL